MTLQIPYEFHPGEKALSQQVNANFEAIKTSVNTVEGNISQMQTNITTLQNNKANINGNSNNTFSVASPVNNYDAVNKQYLNSLTQYMIAGLIISKADDEYITCTPGACFDATGSKILQFALDVSTSEAPYNVSATYYVYIIGMPSGGTNTQLLISSSSSEPALPSGYTLYRALGNFTTDDSGKIKMVSAYSYLTGAAFNNTPYVVETQVSGTRWYRKWSDGWCEQGGKTGDAASGTINLTVSYSNANYTVVGTTKTDTIRLFTISSQSSDSFSYAIKNSDGSTTATRYSYSTWYACGYTN